MPTLFREYKDLDLDLTPHPISGDVTPLTGPDAVRRSIRNIVLTNLFERPFRPNIGSRSAHFLFENVDPLTKYALRQEILSAIKANEIRAKVLQILITENIDERRLEIEIDFSIENIPESFNVTIFLERVR